MMDPEVERRMNRVRKALDNHPEINREARTEIWNRCYEAVYDSLHSISAQRGESVLKKAMRDLNII